VGPGTVIDAAHAAGVGASLRAWGSAVGEAVVAHADALRPIRPPSLDAGLQQLVPISRDRVHTIGWELRHAFSWRNDDRCLQRAAFGALSILERETGSIDAAVASAARGDALRAAVVVQYSPNFGMARMHAAPVMRTTDGEFLVIDHLFADAEDGVLTLQEWLRRSGGSARKATVLPPLRRAPWSITSGAPGMAISAKPWGTDEWSDLADHLAASWQESADHHIPAFMPVQR
jgi:hypothetical protein